jgi:hypothetical protein
LKEVKDEFLGKVVWKGLEDSNAQAYQCLGVPLCELSMFTRGGNDGPASNRSKGLAKGDVNLLTITMKSEDRELISVVRCGDEGTEGSEDVVCRLAEGPYNADET